MKAKITSKTIKSCAVVMLILLNLTIAEGLRADTGGKFHSVDPNQIPNILTMISGQVRSNYECIKTWEGEGDFTIDRIYEGDAAERIFNTQTDGMGEIPKVVLRHIDGGHKFAVDLEKDFLYTEVNRENPPSYIDFETGRDIGTRAVPSQKISIVTPEYYINYGPQQMRNGVITSRKFVKKGYKEGVANKNLSPPVSDPRESFMIEVPIRREAFPRVLEYIKLHGEYSVDGYALKVEECTDGNLTKYRILIPGRVSPEHYIFVTMFFSSAKGFNIVLWEETNPEGKLLHKKTWDYDLVNSVYVPSRTTEQIFRWKNGELSYESKYTYKEQQVNIPIPDETFTYKNLGLQDGDKFIDKIQDKEYTYQDGELVPLEGEQQN